MSSEVFFWADTHFLHDRMSWQFRPGPWSDKYGMTEVLIERWRTRVSKGDRIYFLGDLAFGTSAENAEILDRLTGELHWIRGNHDPKRRPDVGNIASFGDYKEIRVNGQKIILSHYPFEEWNSAHHGSWHLHGHQHGNGRVVTIPRLDVGVDCFDDGPVHFDEIAEIMKEREWIPVSHH